MAPNCCCTSAGCQARQGVHPSSQPELVFGAANNKPSLVRSVLAEAPPAQVEACWAPAVMAAAEAGDAYVLEILLQHPQQPKDAPSSVHRGLLIAAGKGHAGVVALLLKHGLQLQQEGEEDGGAGSRRPFFPPAVIEAAMDRALRGDHAGVLQAILDKAKPDPHVRRLPSEEADADADADADGGGGGGGCGLGQGPQQTPLELALARGSQRCVGPLREYEALWRQRSLQLLIRATLVDSCRLSRLPFAVVGTVLLECLAGRKGKEEPAHSIDEPARGNGKRELEAEAEADYDADNGEEEEEDFPPVFLQQPRGRKRRRSRRSSPRRRSSGSGSGSGDLTLTRPVRKAGAAAQSWSELRKMPLPSDSFRGACAF